VNYVTQIFIQCNNFLLQVEVEVGGEYINVWEA